MNPPPGIGFANKERSSFDARIKELGIDCIMALAIIHHLCISANCTFDMLSESLSCKSEKLLIEFIPPEDSWADKLLKSKRESRSLFSHYNKENFEASFSKRYEFLDVASVPNSNRSLYIMKRKEKNVRLF